MQPFEKQVNSKKKFVKNKRIKNEKKKIKRKDNKILKNELPCLVVKAFKKKPKQCIFLLIKKRAPVTYVVLVHITYTNTKYHDQYQIFTKNTHHDFSIGIYVQYTTT